MGCCASLAVRVSLRQSILHELSRQHTAIGQEILFVILIGFPSLLFGFSLFRILTHRSISGHTSAMLTLSLHRNPCSCPPHLYLPHTFLWCHLCDEGKSLLSLILMHYLCPLFHHGLAMCCVIQHPWFRTSDDTSPASRSGSITPCHHDSRSSAAVPPCTALAANRHPQSLVIIAPQT